MRPPRVGPSPISPNWLQSLFPWAGPDPALSLSFGWEGGLGHWSVRLHLDHCCSGWRLPDCIRSQVRSLALHGPSTESRVAPNRSSGRTSSAIQHVSALRGISPHHSLCPAHAGFLPETGQHCGAAAHCAGVGHLRAVQHQQKNIRVRTHLHGTGLRGSHLTWAVSTWPCFL